MPYLQIRVFSKSEKIRKKSTEKSQTFLKNNFKIAKIRKIERICAWAFSMSRCVYTYPIRIKRLYQHPLISNKTLFRMASCARIFNESENRIFEVLWYLEYV